MFINQAKEYLSNNYYWKYAIWCDWCVHITTVDLYKDIMWKDGKYREEYKKIKENKDIII